MDNIKVTLLHYTPAEVLIEAMSMPYKTENFKKIPTEQAMKKIKAICVDKKHSSVLEHITFNFKIEGISRLCLQELVRHRMSSYTVESTRFTLPKKEEIKNNQFSELCAKAIRTKKHEDFEKAMNILKKYIVVPKPLKPDLERSPVREWKLSWSLRELFDYIEMYGDSDSRDVIKYVLPESWRNNLIMSINIRSLRNLLQLRLSKQAHFEIRHLAGLILEQIPAEYKVLFEDLGEKND